jgi:hypothetical protein
MQFKFFINIVALATLAVAIPPNLGSRSTSSDLECCSQVVDANSTTATTLLGLLGIVAQGVTGKVGITCTVGLMSIYRNIFAQSLLTAC